MEKKVMIIAAIVIAVVAVFGVAYVIGNQNDDHNVNYHGNGGTTIGSQEETMKSSSSTAIEDRFFAKNGFTQIDWNTQADGKGTVYKVGSKIPSGVKDLYAMWYPNIYCKGTTPQSAITGTEYSVTLTGTVHGDSYIKEIYTQGTSGTYGAIVDNAKLTLTLKDATSVHISGDYAIFTTSKFTVYAKFVPISATFGWMSTVGVNAVSVSVSADDSVSFEVELIMQTLSVNPQSVDGLSYKLVSVDALGNEKEVEDMTGTAVTPVWTTTC